MSKLWPIEVEDERKGLKIAKIQVSPRRANLREMCNDVDIPSKKRADAQAKKEGGERTGEQIIQAAKAKHKLVMDQRVNFCKSNIIRIKQTKTKQPDAYVISDIDRDGDRITRLVQNSNPHGSAASQGQKHKEHINNAASSFNVSQDQLLALLSLARENSKVWKGTPINSRWGSVDETLRLDSSGSVRVNTFTKDELLWYDVIQNALRTDKWVDEKRKSIDTWEKDEREFNATLTKLLNSTTERSRVFFEGLFEWNLEHPFELDELLMVVLGNNHTGKSSLTKLYMSSICGDKFNVNMNPVSAQHNEKTDPFPFGNLRDDINAVTKQTWDQFKNRRTLPTIKERYLYQDPFEVENQAMEVWTANWRSVEPPPGHERRYVLISLDDRSAFTEFFDTVCGIEDLVHKAEKDYSPTVKRWIRRRLMRMRRDRGESFNREYYTGLPWQASSCPATIDKLLKTRASNSADGQTVRGRIGDFQDALHRWDAISRKQKEDILQDIVDYESGFYKSFTGLEEVHEGDSVGTFRLTPSFIAKVLTSLGCVCNWQMIKGYISHYAKIYEIEYTGHTQKRYYEILYYEDETQGDYPLSEVRDIIAHIVATAEGQMKEAVGIEKEYKVEAVQL